MGGFVVISGVLLITIGENQKQDSNLNSNSNSNSSIELISTSNKYTKVAIEGDEEDNNVTYNEDENAAM